MVDGKERGRPLSFWYYLVICEAVLWTAIVIYSVFSPQTINLLSHDLWYLWTGDELHLPGPLFLILYTSFILSILTLRMDLDRIDNSGTNIAYITDSKLTRYIRLFPNLSKIFRSDLPNKGENASKENEITDTLHPQYILLSLYLVFGCSGLYLIIGFVSFAVLSVAVPIALIHLYWIFSVREKAFENEHVFDKIKDVEQILDGYSEEQLPVAHEVLDRAEQLDAASRYEQAEKAAERARRIAEVETEIGPILAETRSNLDEIDDVCLEADNSGDREEAGTLRSVVAESQDLLESSQRHLKEGRFDEARARAESALETSKEAVDCLTAHGKDAVSDAENAVRREEYGDAIDAWDRAYEAYDDAHTLATAFDRENAVETVEMALEHVETERERSRMFAAATDGVDSESTGRSKFENDEYEAARNAFEEALEAYRSARTIAEKNGFDYQQRSESSVERVRKQLDECKLAEKGRRIADLVTQLENEQYDQAQQSFEQLRAELEEARNGELRNLHDRDPERLESLLERVENRIDDCVIGKTRQRVAAAEEMLEAGDHEQAEERFEELIDEIEALDVYDEAAVQDLSERAKRGHLEAQIEQGRAKIEQARARFEERDYYRASETFEETTTSLEQVLSLASVYGFTEKKTEIAKLVKLCLENADRARQALYETGGETPELESLDEIDVTAIDPVEREAHQDRASPSGGSDSLYRTQSYDFDVESLRRQSSDDRVDQPLPAHERLTLIGEGGNARVWHVRMEESGEDAALKVPKYEGTISTEVVERFLQEAETWSRIDDHPNIVTVHDWGVAAYPWLLMEYMEAGDLRPHVGSMPFDQALRTLIEVADALRYARGVDHLDIKPENVLLDGAGTAKLADWGLAKVAFQHEQTDTRLGISPPYAAPEQIHRPLGPLDHRTDIYQLGVTGYELLTGQVPFDPTAPESLERRILAGDPRMPTEVNPELPAEVDDVILRAMAVEPTDRYEAPVQFRDALTELRDASVGAGTDTPS